VLRVVALACVCACGRVDFDAEADVSDARAGDAAGNLCAQHPGVTFCSDFDEGTIGWDNVAMAFGSVALDSAESKSPPGSLQIDTTTITAGQDPDVGVTKSFGVATQVILAFDVFIDVLGSNEPILCQLAFDDGSQIHAIELVERVPTGVAYIEDTNTVNGMGPTFGYFQAMPLDRGAWHHVEIDYTSGAAARLSLAFDGATQIDTAPMFTTGGQLTLQLGIIYLGTPAMAWRAHFDNVIVLAQ
jgi:hypothetical protein